MRTPLRSRSFIIATACRWWASLLAADIAMRVHAADDHVQLIDAAR